MARPWVPLTSCARLRPSTALGFSQVSFHLCTRARTREANFPTCGLRDRQGWVAGTRFDHAFRPTAAANLRNLGGHLAIRRPSLAQSIACRFARNGGSSSKCLTRAKDSDHRARRNPMLALLCFTRILCLLCFALLESYVCLALLTCLLRILCFAYLMDALFTHCLFTAYLLKSLTRAKESDHRVRRNLMLACLLY